MKPIPSDPIGQHNRFIEALCADWRETGIVTLEAKHTPRAQRILEIGRQTLKPGPATLWLEGVADEVLAMPQDAARAGPASPGAKCLVSAIRGPSTIARKDGV